MKNLNKILLAGFLCGASTVAFSQSGSNTTETGQSSEVKKETKVTKNQTGFEVVAPEPAVEKAEDVYVKKQPAVVTTEEEENTESVIKD